MSDLVVLVADKNMEAATSTILTRHKSLGVRSLDFVVYVHPERDPGCRGVAHDFLRPFARTHEHALVMFDRAGCGAESSPSDKIECEVLALLASAGWGDRAGAIVIDPELEAWVWADSPHVEHFLGWSGRPRLRDQLEAEDLWPAADAKPPNPKNAVEWALRVAKKPRSSSIYEAIAGKVSLANCSDASFLRFRNTLNKWFPKPSDQ